MELNNKLRETMDDRNSISSLLLVPFSATLILLAWFLTDLGADPDLFHRLATGRLIEALGYVPLKDPFAFSPKKEFWIDHEWLSGFVFFKTWSFSGEAGLFALKIIFAFLSLLVLYKASRNHNANSSALSFWFIILVIASAFVWRSTIRSQVFTYLFIPTVLLSFTEYKKHSRRFLLYCMPVIMCVWANAHGGFVVGLGFLGIFTFNQLLKEKLDAWPIVLVFLLSIATTFINPYPGTMYWEYIIHAVGMPRPFVPEWDPLSPLSHSAILPNLVVVILLYGFVKHRTNRDLLSMLLLLSSAYFGYKHQRLSPIFLMTATVYGAEAFKVFVQDLSSLFGTKNLSGYFDAAKFVYKFAVCIALAWSLYAFGSMASFKLDYSDYPTKAAAWLKENKAGGNILVTFNHGSYVLWELYPEFKVSVDGRYEETYPESTMHLVMDAYWGSEEEQDKALKTLQPDFIISDAAASFPKESWKQAFNNQNTLVWEKLL